jgi:hypothetical protein
VHFFLFSRRNISESLHFLYTCLFFFVADVRPFARHVPCSARPALSPTTAPCSAVRATGLLGAKCEVRMAVLTLSCQKSAAFDWLTAAYTAALSVNDRCYIRSSTCRRHFPVSHDCGVVSWRGAHAERPAALERGAADASVDAFTVHSALPKLRPQFVAHSTGSGISDVQGLDGPHSGTSCAVGALYSLCIASIVSVALVSEFKEVVCICLAGKVELH